uniref:Protein kinase domain-containing protein n=1 Tax=Palpitomonas bilix TaxID=652834 RepID=A0A7S3D817_9EUKA|mmetsp:Transcript_26309/g.66972  ORF Transcript_26309/g.66972 Transcript_26309/m.66972 type:complete len:330 (+) Transcript_26309:1401-2390(+)
MHPRVHASLHHYKSSRVANMPFSFSFILQQKGLSALSPLGRKEEHMGEGCIEGDLPTPLISDFGLAAETSQAQLRTFCGTVDFLSPEPIASRFFAGGIREVIAGKTANGLRLSESRRPLYNVHYSLLPSTFFLSSCPLSYLFSFPIVAHADCRSNAPEDYTKSKISTREDPGAKRDQSQSKMVKGSSFGLRKLPDAISKNKRVPYDEHCDMWSFGVLAFVTITDSHPFRGSSRNSTLNNILRARIRWTSSEQQSSHTSACSDAQSSDADAPETLIFSASAEGGHTQLQTNNSRDRLPKDFVNFFENLFTLNPEKRMSAERALAHAYLRI